MTHYRYKCCRHTAELLWSTPDQLLNVFCTRSFLPATLAKVLRENRADCREGIVCLQLLTKTSRDPFTDRTSIRQEHVHWEMNGRLDLRHKKMKHYRHGWIPRHLSNNTSSGRGFNSKGTFISGCVYVWWEHSQNDEIELIVINTRNVNVSG